LAHVCEEEALEIGVDDACMHVCVYMYAYALTPAALE